MTTYMDDVTISPNREIDKLHHIGRTYQITEDDDTDQQNNDEGIKQQETTTWTHNGVTITMPIAKLITIDIFTKVNTNKRDLDTISEYDTVRQGRQKNNTH